jgi:branched-chain amino acid transport system permease protein
MGVVSSLLQWALPASSSITAAIIPSVPFALIVVFVVVELVRRGGVAEVVGVSGSLDRAVRPHGVSSNTIGAVWVGDDGVAGQDGASQLHSNTVRTLIRRPRNMGALATLGIGFVLPVVLSSFWLDIYGGAIAFAIVFLSYTLVTGEGGMIWLCQITFAGVGAITTAQLATEHQWPVLIAILAGGLLSAVLGGIVGILTLRLGDLYVAIVTLTFGLLMENLVFSRNIFYQYGAGVSVSRPSFAESDAAFAYLALVAFSFLALLIVNLRVSTTGLAMAAVRSSDVASRSIGLSIANMKLLISFLAAFVAGVGGGFLACFAQAAVTDSYLTVTGTVVLAVVVTIGARSSTGALLAGILYTCVPALFLLYLPGPTWAQVPAILFGLGAVMVARHPNGLLSMHADQIADIYRLVRHAPMKVSSTPKEDAHTRPAESTTGGPAKP